MDEQFLMATELLMKQAKDVYLDNQTDVQSMVLGAAASGDSEIMGQVLQSFQFAKLNQIAEPYPFYHPAPEELYVEPENQGLLVGRVKNTEPPVPFYLFMSWIASHVLIVGRTGCGKTTLLFTLLFNLLSKQIPVIIFDRKNDFRHFLRINNNILVIRVRREFKFNPLAVPSGVDPLVWAEVVVDIACREFKILEGGRAILLTTVIQLYRRFDIFTGSQHFPTLFDIVKALLAIKIPRNSRRWQSIETLLGRFEALLAAHGDMFDCAVGFNLDDLLQKPCVVFETNGLAETTTSFLINLILQHPFQQRLARQERGLGLRNVIFLEECRHVLHPFKNSEIGYGSIENILSEGREFGIGIIAASQSAHLNPAIHINSFIKVVFSLGDGQQIKNIKTSLQLDEGQTRYLTSLKTGEAIVKAPCFANPFCLQIMPFPLS